MLPAQALEISLRDLNQLELCLQVEEEKKTTCESAFNCSYNSMNH